MKRQLTEAEIEELFLFCRKHYVEYYDLQVELVDHLASGIEDIWFTSPEVSFEQALNKVYGGFGVGGFGKIKYKRLNSLKAKYRNKAWSYFVHFFKPPKIVLTIVATVLLFQIFKKLSSLDYVLLIYSIITIIFVFGYLKFVENDIKKLQPDPKTKFLLKDVYNSWMSSKFVFINILVQGQFIFNDFKLDYSLWWHALILSCFIVLTTIFLYVSCFVIPKEMSADFKVDYNKIFIVRN